MIKKVMVRLDGTSRDDGRLAAVNEIPTFLRATSPDFFNVLSSTAPECHADASQAGQSLNIAKHAGDIVEGTVFERLSQCREFDANLLVMGSYGHSSLHDLLPGSTPDRVLHRVPIPLFIAH